MSSEIKNRPNMSSLDYETVKKCLEKARKDLLDLSARNRMLNTPRKSTRSSRIEIVGMHSSEVFDILVRQERKMRFRPKPDEEDISSGEESEIEEFDFFSNTNTYNNCYLQTDLSKKELHRKLLRLYYDARTYEEEQGVNILFLALGFLKWYEDENSQIERYAPLILLPVELERKSTRGRFFLQYTDDELETNLSLKERLLLDFEVELPDLPDVDDLDPEEYYREVKRAISGYPNWEVLENDIVLWFFSYTKFLMYRDLDPELWRDILINNGKRSYLIRSLCGVGFREEQPLVDDLDKSASLDSVLDPKDCIHVLDADSSQALVIEEVKRGRNLVIQGPPGTGKSQTITNIIAASVAAGKTVLFVTEKMAALEVVKRRLDNIDLGDICLELHSRKANKKNVLKDIEKTLHLGLPRKESVDKLIENLRRDRDRLNQYVKILHETIGSSDMTPFKALGHLVKLRQKGISPSHYHLPNALNWTEADFRRWADLVRDAVRHLTKIKDPLTHPWRGVQVEVILPSDMDRLRQKISLLKRHLTSLVRLGAEISRILQVEPAKTLNEFKRLIRTAEHILEAPLLDRQSISNSVWQERRTELYALLMMGFEWHSCYSQIKDIVSEIAWSIPLEETRRDLAGYGKYWFRWFIPAYWRARATVRGILKGPMPKGYQEKVHLVDLIIKGQRLRRELLESMFFQLGREAFGTLWRGLDSDWEALKEIADWEARGREKDILKNFRTILSRIADNESLEKTVETANALMSDITQVLKSILETLQFDVEFAFGERDIENVSMQEIIDRLDQWLENASTEQLQSWIDWWVRYKHLCDKGFEEVADALARREIDPDRAIDQLRYTWCEQLLREAYNRFPELIRFDGTSHEEVINRFKKLDIERIRLARQEVALQHFNQIPHGSIKGEMGVLYREIHKRRRHLPFRKLFQKAGNVIQDIKPVFMMSPLTVAQFLDPNALEFDIVIMDEASQIRPVDAFGAVLRGKQLVVVGDDQQLPPTSFFDRLMDEERADDEEDDQSSTRDMESILELCLSKGMPKRMLEWHYRSRHHSLIAVSNQAFYHNSLFIVPSPHIQDPNLGLRFVYVKEGRYDRAGKRTNEKEAEEVVRAIIDHATNHPNETLGVGTFSVAQRDLILDLLEEALKERTDLEPFFARKKAEPFFVKNLENIQGDERDVIFISIGYGKDENGYLSMHFGPLNREGGYRRLNVLITRARKRCVVFSSIRHSDIDLNRTNARGVVALKQFLQFAETGNLDLPKVSGDSFQSPFEEAVAMALSNAGYKVHPQVGVAGFFIDLAVVHPDNSAQYVLGIECDGATYHRARWARDRDRLRQQILEDRGWTIHRIWSTDWFRKPQEELRKVLKAIERARLNSPSIKEEEDDDDIDKKRRPSIQRKGRIEDRKPISQPYVEASRKSIDVPEWVLPQELGLQRLLDILYQIVRIESPIHIEELGRRVCDLWDNKIRLSKKLNYAIKRAVRWGVQLGKIKVEHSFVYDPEQKSIPIRDRSQVQSRSLRKPELIPPQEIRAAILSAIEQHPGMTEEEIIDTVVECFGFQRTPRKLPPYIQEQLEYLLQQSKVLCNKGRYYSKNY